MTSLDHLPPLRLPEALRQRLADAPLPGLDGGPPDAALTAWLKVEGASLGTGSPPRDTAMADAARAGLWLLAGDLDRSHQISQGIDSSEGSYWHGIMHRREGDYSNAKYWFGRAGRHAIEDPLAAAAVAFAEQAAGGVVTPEGRWDAGAFVDACSQAVEQGRGQSACIALQWIEWQLLFGHCFQRAWQAES